VFLLVPAHPGSAGQRAIKTIVVVVVVVVVVVCVSLRSQQSVGSRVHNKRHTSPCYCYCSSTAMFGQM